MGKGQPQIANTIRTLRFNAGEMTQAALAEKVGVTRQTIVAIEANDRGAGLEQSARIATRSKRAIEDAGTLERLQRFEHLCQQHRHMWRLLLAALRLAHLRLELHSGEGRVRTIDPMGYRCTLPSPD